MGIAGLILVPHLSKSGKSFLFYSCTSDVIVISQNSQWVKSYKNTKKPSSPGIQRFLIDTIDSIDLIDSIKLTLVSQITMEMEQMCRLEKIQNLINVWA